MTKTLPTKRLRPLSNRARVALLELLRLYEDGVAMVNGKSMHGSWQTARVLERRGLISNDMRSSPHGRQQHLDMIVPAGKNWYSLTPKGIDQARRLRVVHRLDASRRAGRSSARHR